MENTAYLVLSDGTVYQGKRFGAFRDSMGETVFTTACTGYLETITDLSYTHQLLVCAFPMLGNYGVNAEDLQGDRAGIDGIIVREYSEHPSNFRCKGKISDLLEKLNVPGLYGIDTRALVRRLRNEGIMNGCICSDPAGVDLKALADYRPVNPVDTLSCKTTIEYACENARYRVGVLDLGLGVSCAEALCRDGCAVTLYPHNVTADEILASNVEGIVISGGAGDPRELEEEQATVQVLLKAKKPLCGIGHGHLLMAVAEGLPVVKMKYGHHGENQPVRDNSTGIIVITAQNHGYTVKVQNTANPDCILAYSNCNDRGCEGLLWTNQPAVSFQFDPLAVAGPRDSASLMNHFYAMMDAIKED